MPSNGRRDLIRRLKVNRTFRRIISLAVSHQTVQFTLTICGNIWKYTQTEGKLFKSIYFYLKEPKQRNNFLWLTTLLYDISMLTVCEPAHHPSNFKPPISATGGHPKGTCFNFEFLTFSSINMAEARTCEVRTPETLSFKF